MDNLITAQAAKYLELKDRRAVLEDELKLVKDEAKELSDVMVAGMEEAGLENFALNGMTFYIRSTVHASVPAEKRETFIRRLRARKLGNLVKPVIQANTLTSFVKEQIEVNGGSLPVWMEDLVSVYIEAELGTRKR